MFDTLSKFSAYSKFYRNSNIKDFADFLNKKLQDINQELNNLNLFDYTTKEGDLLEYIALCLYGIKRPIIQLDNSVSEIGGLGNTPMIGLGFLAAYNSSVPPSEKVNDDVFKRLIMWHVFIGDGYIFNVDFFKRKIKRFINENMYETITDYYEISVNITNKTITMPYGYLSLRFKWLYLNNFLKVPLHLQGYNVELD